MQSKKQFELMANHKAPKMDFLLVAASLSIIVINVIVIAAVYNM